MQIICWSDEFDEATRQSREYISWVENVEILFEANIFFLLRKEMISSAA